MKPRTRDAWIESVLLGAGLVMLGCWAAATLSALAYQHAAGRIVDAWSGGGWAAAEGTAAAGRTATGGRRLAGGPLGRLEIPRLGLRVIVAEGTDARTLEHAVGHLAGSALPGEPGNVALVGHRDTYFRRLALARRGDRIDLVAPDGRHRYRVQDIAVVSPRRVDVLAPTPEPCLTLVTCYPFHVLGPAPRRFVVRAAAIEGLRSASQRSPTASAAVAAWPIPAR